MRIQTFTQTDENDEDKKCRSSSLSGSRGSSSSQKEEEKQEQGEINNGVEIADNLSYEEKVKKAMTGDMDFNYPEKK